MRHAVTPTLLFGRVLRWTFLSSVVSTWQFSLLFLKVEDISWLSIFPATTSLPAISRPNSIVRLWAIQTTTQAEQQSQKRAPIAHGHPTGRPTGIVISLTMVAETKVEWWATSYAWLACRRWGGSKEVTGAKVWCESPGTPRTWGLDISNLYEYGRYSCKKYSRRLRRWYVHDWRG